MISKRILILNINNIFWVYKKALVLIPKLTLAIKALAMVLGSKKMLFLKKKNILKLMIIKIKYRKINSMTNKIQITNNNNVLNYTVPQFNSQ